MGCVGCVLSTDVLVLTAWGSVIVEWSVIVCSGVVLLIDAVLCRLVLSGTHNRLKNIN